VKAEIALQHSKGDMITLYKHISKDIFEEAAKAILAKPNNRNILLFTGCVAKGTQITDGPVGTYFLAKALFDLGYYPIVITDFHCKDYFDQADQNFETLIVPKKGFSQSFMYAKIIETYDPVAMISIERPGRSKDGHYRNTNGDLIDGQNAPIDQFFLEEAEQILTIGIGDGGTEIGMGNYQKQLISELNFLSPCCISVDYCLIGTTSNWATYALIALISNSSLPTDDAVEAYYEYILQLGAIDGISGKSEKSVDGHYISTSLAIINSLRV